MEGLVFSWHPIFQVCSFTVIYLFILLFSYKFSTLSLISHILSSQFILLVRLSNEFFDWNSSTCIQCFYFLIEFSFKILIYLHHSIQLYTCICLDITQVFTIIFLEFNEAFVHVFLSFLYSLIKFMIDIWVKWSGII